MEAIKLNEGNTIRKKYFLMVSEQRFKIAIRCCIDNDKGNGWDSYLFCFSFP